MKSGESSILLKELHDAVVTMKMSCLEGRLLSLVVDISGQGVISSSHHFWGLGMRDFPTRKAGFTLAAMATVIKLTSECMSVKTKDCFFKE